MPADYSKFIPTAELRFVENADGARVLQQCWTVFKYSPDHVPKGQHLEWQDVPFVGKLVEKDGK